MVKRFCVTDFQTKLQTPQPRTRRKMRAEKTPPNKEKNADLRGTAVFFWAKKARARRLVCDSKKMPRAKKERVLPVKVVAARSKPRAPKKSLTKGIRRTIKKTEVGKTKNER